MASFILSARATLSMFAAAAVLAPAVATMSAAPPQTSTPAAAKAAPDVTKLGPQLGEKVPDFTLPDQQGRPRTLASLMGPKGLVLLFSRSADW